MNNKKGLLATLSVMLLWGLLFPLVKLGYLNFGISSVGDILTFAGLRFTVCGALITLFVFFKDKSLFANVRKNIFSLLLSGLFAIILHYGFTYMGLSTTDGSKTAIMKQLGAVVYVCFAGLIFPEEKLTYKKIAGLILSIGGIFAINLGGGRFGFSLGDILIILASVCTVFSNVVSKKALMEVNPVTLTGLSQLFGGGVLLLVGTLCGGNVMSVIPNTATEGLIFAAIITASVISYCLWFSVVKKGDLSKLFIIKFSEPLFSAVFSWLLIGENIFKWNYLVAFLLISLGITVANKKEK